MFRFQDTNLYIFWYNITIVLPSRTSGNRLKEDIKQKKS
jgi:hypothetical protein